jgi:hypothetical protein
MPINLPDGRNERVTKSRPVEATDTLNIIPFKGAEETEKFVWRGLYFKKLALSSLTNSSCSLLSCQRY